MKINQLLLEARIHLVLFASILKFSVLEKLNFALDIVVQRVT